MDKISVNKLVEEVKSNLPREILVLIAQSCLNENTDSQIAIENFEKEVYKLGSFESSFLDNDLFFSIESLLNTIIGIIIAPFLSLKYLSF